MATFKIIIEDIPHAKEGEENIIVTMEGFSDIDKENITSAQALALQAVKFIMDSEEGTYEIQSEG